MNDTRAPGGGDQGRALDTRVARDVLGKRPCVFIATGRFSAWATMWRCEHENSANCYPSNAEAIEHHHSVLPPYSTNVGAAWSVVERMRALGWAFALVDCDVAEAPQALWRASFGYVRHDADTPPLAICHAALDAALRATAPATVPQAGGGAG